jgi:hypothetical protein
MTLRTDIFISKKEQVYNFIRQKGRARTSEVIVFGSSIYSNRADKDARDLANPKITNPPKIGRLKEDLKKLYYPNTCEDIWTIYKEEWEIKEWKTP